MKQTYYLASTYGEGAYNSGTYSGCIVNAQTSICEPTHNSGGSVTSALVNTGVGVAIAISLAAAIIFSAMLIRFFKKPKDNKDQD
jgi:hypothetical protein